jgi:hypothetical protein
VPRAPRWLRLRIEREWDGPPVGDRRLHGELRLRTRASGLEVAASLPHQEPARIPPAPPGTRVADLFDYDVVECFVVGADGRYLEVELGAGGHFLVLSFRAPRVRSDEHATLAPGLRFDPGAARWRSSLCLPWELVPRPVEALNAFASVGGRLLAYGPVPGPRPDFHRPELYPRARLAPPGES